MTNNAADGSTAGPEDETLALAHALFDAAREGDSALLGSYLDAGAPANMTNASGDSLLMLAAYHGHAPAVELLLRHGADANAANDRGQTPLAGAAFKGYADVAEALRLRAQIPTPARPPHGQRHRCLPALTFWRCWADRNARRKHKMPESPRDSTRGLSCALILHVE